jgi:L-ascorbate metabolism protein UlaG (beta-lactamase superfamily)
MKITKFVHSCLLVEEEDVILIDPGKYSWQAGIFDVQKLKKLDAVVITHEHEDHFYPEFVQMLVKKFPNVSFTTTPHAAADLRDMGIRQVFTESNRAIKIFSKKQHASIEPLGPSPPGNIAVHVLDTLTVGGDRQDLEETKDILAFSITAPWGSEKDAAKMLDHLRPRYALPIHDWHWQEKARAKEYSRFADFCEERGVHFLTPTNGEVIEISV